MRPKKYKHLFFDLDRTLYDFEQNNRQTLLDLYSNHHLQSKGIECFDTFYNTYKRINVKLWLQYKNKEISKDYLNQSRFSKTLGEFNITNGLGEVFAREFIAISPLQTRVMPGTFEILDYLFPNYVLHIITNGFEELQYQKLLHCNLHKYFTHVVTSEKAGAQKPNEAIFRHAMEITGATPQESLIIGDEPESDILGGKMFNMDQAWLSLAGETSEILPTYHIHSLLDLKSFL